MLHVGMYLLVTFFLCDAQQVTTLKLVYCTVVGVVQLELYL